MSDFFTEKLNNFNKELDKKEEAKRKEEIYIDPEPIKEREMEIQNNALKQETKDFFKEEIKKIQEKINKTKFKKRFNYRIDDQQECFIFYLDDKAVAQLDYSDFYYNYVPGKLSKEIIDNLYTMENAYTLIDFVDRKCFVSEIKLKHRMRMTLNEFIYEYVSYTEEKFGADKVMNLKRIVRVLKKHYDCDKVKYKNKVYLNKVITLDKYQNALDSVPKITTDKEKIFEMFLNEFCVISDFILPQERIKRSDFRTAYLAFLKQMDYERYRLTSQEFNIILLKKYNENFIKSNGIFYMKKIKFKKF